MKKKNVKKDLKVMMKNNETIIEIMNDFNQRYNFSAEDVFIIETLQKHLENMNVLFKQMQEI